MDVETGVCQILPSGLNIFDVWELSSAVSCCTLHRRRLDSGYLSNRGAEVRFCDS